VILGLLFLYLSGITVLPGILLIIVFAMMFLKLRLVVGRLALPFSVAFSTTSSRSVATVFAFMALAGIFAALHGFFIKNNLVLTLVAIGATIVINRVIDDALLKKGVR
jgi:O-antigen ligase